jgi:hypothetical protein
MPLNDLDGDKDKFQLMSCNKKVRKERKLLEHIIKVKNASWLYMHVCT